MKAQMMRPNQMNSIDMMNNQSMMGTANLLQKIGKGKRKFNIKIEKHNKKFLEKIAAEMKKQIIAYGDNPQMKGVVDFFNYLEICAKGKDNEIKLSYEELDFLKKTIVQSAQQMGEAKFKWYQFWKKWIYKVMVKQYKMLVNDINK